MPVRYKNMYAYSVERIKEHINFNYKERERQKTAEDKNFYDGIIMGLFECLDMMRSDIIIFRSEKDLKEVGLDFEPFDKKDSGTLFDDVEDFDYAEQDDPLPTSPDKSPTEQDEN